MAEQTGERPLPQIENYLDKSSRVEKIPLPKSREIEPNLMGIAERIAEISGAWNPVEIYTPDPDNLKKEKQTFFQQFSEGKVYNPTFSYPYAEQLDLAVGRVKLEALQSKVRKLKPKTTAERNLRAALYFKIKDDLATCHLVDGIKTKNEPKIGEALKRKYPGTNPALLAYAQQEYERLIKGKPEKETQQPILSKEEQLYLKNLKFNASSIKSAFEWTLGRMGILKTPANTQGFQVVIDEKATGIDVRDKSQQGPTVFIPKSREVSGDKLLELMAHELEGHARQSLNGAKLFKIGGGRLKIDDETLYEGLAKRYDDNFHKRFFGTTEGTPGPFYALAVSKAEQGGSFWDIFSDQLDKRLHIALKIPPAQKLPIKTQIPPDTYQKAMDNAWTTAYRVMRGHTDTGNPEKFAMAKDLAYLQGWLLDKQMVERGLGHINEAAVFQSGALQLVANFRLTEKDLPYPYKDVTRQYWSDVLKPIMEKQITPPVKPNVLKKLLAWLLRGD